MNILNNFFILMVQSNMKTLKICLVILCLLHVRAVGLPQFSGALSFMKTIEIKSKKYGIHHLLVDDEDFEKVNKYKWHIDKSRNKIYATTAIYNNKVLTNVRVYRIILGDSYKLIDHKDGNGLNNQKSNLRPCTHAQNMYNSGPKSNNTSGYKGVYYSKTRRGTKKYIAQIGINGKMKFIGCFYNPVDAAIAYNRVASELHGEFANLNLV